MTLDQNPGSEDSVPSRKVKVQVVNEDGSSSIAETSLSVSKVQPTVETRLKRLGTSLWTTLVWIVMHPKWVLEWVLVILVIQVLWTKGLDGLKDFVKALME